MPTRRWRPWLGVALLVGFAAGAGLLWSQRATVVETLALRLLAARAIPAALRVVRFDLAGLELADLSVGEAGALAGRKLVEGAPSGQFVKTNGGWTKKT